MTILNKQKAFTLIELLVVIAIIAILTAIVMSNFTQAKAKARDAKRVSDIAQIQLALELYFDRCNIYPTDITRAVGSITEGCTGLTPPVTLGTFISKIPSDPTTGAIYQYGAAADGSDYIIKAVLETQNVALQDRATPTVFYGTFTNASCVSYIAPTYDYCMVPK